MTLKKKMIARWGSLLATIVLLAVACTQAQPTAEIQVVRETVEVTVPVVVTQIVERVVTREVIIVQDSAGGEVETLIVTATPAPTQIPTPTPAPTERSPEDIGQVGDFDAADLDKLFEVWGQIEENFYGELPSDDILTDAIIKATLEQLNDRYTIYYPPEIAKRMNDGFRGDFEGIGAYVDTDENGYFFIVRPIPNTPAFQAGIKPGDIITHVDGEHIVGWTTDEVVAIVRGPRGEPVVLTIQREGTAEPFDLTIIRDRIVVPVVETQALADGKIGYVRLVSFNQVASQQLEIEVTNHINNGVETIIFDLRDNGGGLLDAAVSIGDLFLDEGLFVIIRNSDDTMEQLTTGDGDIAESINMVVLVNENSASASELLAAALKDYGRATLIGTTTFGKGSVQNVFEIDDGSQYRITKARFFSPNDNAINQVGVSPDIFFDYRPEILGDENDLTLQRAIEFILEGE